MRIRINKEIIIIKAIKKIFSKNNITMVMSAATMKNIVLSVP